MSSNQNMSRFRTSLRAINVQPGFLYRGPFLRGSVPPWLRGSVATCTARCRSHGNASVAEVRVQGRVRVWERARVRVRVASSGCGVRR